MRPTAFFGLASLAGLCTAVPAAAQPRGEDGNSKSTFGEGVAAIIAERGRGESGTWAGLDRDRLASGFRLAAKPGSDPQPAGPPDQLLPPVAVQREPLRTQGHPMPSQETKQHAPLRRRISFSVDGLPDFEQLAVKVEPVQIRSADEGLPQSRACEGLMPAMSCTTVANVAGGPRVALAYLF